MEDLATSYGFDPSLPAPGPRLSAAEMQQHIEHVSAQRSCLRTRMGRLRRTLQWLESLHQTAVLSELAVKWGSRPLGTQNMKADVATPGTSDVDLGAAEARVDGGASASGHGVALAEGFAIAPGVAHGVSPSPGYDNEYKFLVVCPLPRLDFF